MVLLEEEEWDLARMLGLTNLSGYVRDAISYFISASDRELTPSEVRELSKKFALEKRAALQQQQKITGITEEESRKINEAREKRAAHIREAVKLEVDRIGSDRFKRYLEDPFGDFTKIQDDIIAAVGKASGYTVELADVIAAFKEVRA